MDIGSPVWIDQIDIRDNRQINCTWEKVQFDFVGSVLEGNIFGGRLVIINCFPLFEAFPKIPKKLVVLLNTRMKAFNQGKSNANADEKKRHLSLALESSLKPKTMSSVSSPGSHIWNGCC